MNWLPTTSQQWRPSSPPTQRPTATSRSICQKHCLLLATSTSGLRLHTLNFRPATVGPIVCWIVSPSRSTELRRPMGLTTFPPADQLPPAPVEAAILSEVYKVCFIRALIAKLMATPVVPKTILKKKVSFGETHTKTFYPFKPLGGSPVVSVA